ncbi:hypothetical protein VB780_07185 [Leptolyngbya sp. CCNP1308]|uniref:hypothetical protein n=1 Tax=Leptolyngbya sp. CCNP1308 TaxID=3110255 RepID=UPI002B1F0D37|nr:hypothetical protein [Leptolyngbya sp. CCNP1308]MEA5448345.1 hypothetical protein [Leptolyngbya sp. CCNP1308]
MTAIDFRRVADGGDIPDDLPSTLEAALFFFGGKYNQIYGSATYSELQASAVDNGQRTIGSADVVQTPAGTRAIIRASMPIATNWAEEGPAYTSIQPQSAALLP